MQEDIKYHEPYSNKSPSVILEETTEKLEVAEINMHIHSQSLRKKILPISKWHPVRLVDKARELRLRGSGHLEAG